MLIQTLVVSFGDLEPEISWSKGGPGPSTGGPPLEGLGLYADLEESASHHHPGDDRPKPRRTSIFNFAKINENNIKKHQKTF